MARSATVGATPAAGRIGQRVDHGRRVAVVGRLQRPGDGTGGHRLELQPVGAAPNPDDAPGIVLVAEGVAQDLDGLGPGDHVAVAVEPAVDLGEGQLAVAVEDLEAGVAEHPASQRDGVAAGWRERVDVDRRWAAAPAPVDGGVELVADVGQRLEDVEPVVRRSELGLVVAPQLGDQLLRLDVEGEALHRPET